MARPDGRVFYVGKGVQDRPQSHLIEARGSDCYCRKCKIIRRIWDSRKNVVITTVFETDDEQEALRFEARLIQELSQTEQLCNKMGNKNYNGIPPERGAETVDEYVALLKRMRIAPAEHKRLIHTWVQNRLAHLDSQRREFCDQGCRKKRSRLPNGSGSMSNGKLKAGLQGHQNALHPSCRC